MPTQTTTNPRAHGARQRTCTTWPCGRAPQPPAAAPEQRDAGIAPVRAECRARRVRAPARRDPQAVFARVAHPAAAAVAEMVRRQPHRLSRRRGRRPAEAGGQHAPRRRGRRRAARGAAVVDGVAARAAGRPAMRVVAGWRRQSAQPRRDPALGRAFRRRRGAAAEAFAAAVVRRRRARGRRRRRSGAVRPPGPRGQRDCATAWRGIPAGGDGRAWRRRRVRARRCRSAWST